MRAGSEEKLKEKIKEILIRELGYSEYVAELTAKDLMDLKPELKGALAEWLDNRREEVISICGISTKDLIEDKEMTYPSALISLNWVLRDPEKAIPELKNIIRRRDTF